MALAKAAFYAECEDMVREFYLKHDKEEKADEAPIHMYSISAAAALNMNTARCKPLLASVAFLVKDR